MIKIEGEIHFSEFDAATVQEWQEKIIKDLKGKDYDKTLIKPNREGIEIPPNFHPDQYKVIGQKIGEAPYRRGWRKDNYWETRVPVFGSDSKSLNKEILFALENGASTISIPSHEYNFSKLFEDVQLDVIYIDFESLSIEESKSLQAYCKSCQYDPSNIKGWINKDWSDHTKEELNQLISLWSAYGNFRPIKISVSEETNQGLTLNHQLGLALSKINEVIHGISDEISIDDFSSAVIFDFSASTDLFLEIAKIRAFKVMYAHFIKQYQPDHGCSSIATIHSETSTWNASQKDTYTNLLRHTIAATGAVLGDIDVLTVSPFDINNPESKFVQRMSRNISLILRDESFFSRVADPAGGSYYVEYLTDQLIEKSWLFFQKIEGKGGFYKAKDWIAQVVESDRKALLDSYEENQILVGINKYQPEKATGTIQKDTIASNIEQ